MSSFPTDGLTCSQQRVAMTPLYISSITRLYRWSIEVEPANWHGYFFEHLAPDSNRRFGWTLQRLSLLFYFLGASQCTIFLFQNKTQYTGRFSICLAMWVELPCCVPPPALPWKMKTRAQDEPWPNVWPLVFFPPAMCDMMWMFLMYVGKWLTYLLGWTFWKWG